MFVERGTEPTPAGLDDAFFDRGKVASPPGATAQASSTDIVIVDGTAHAARMTHQVLVRIFAALSDNEAHGYLPHEDLINAICGFCTKALE